MNHIESQKRTCPPIRHRGIPVHNIFLLIIKLGICAFFWQFCANYRSKKNFFNSNSKNFKKYLSIFPLYTYVWWFFHIYVIINLKRTKIDSLGIIICPSSFPSFSIRPSPFFELYSFINVAQTNLKNS